MEEVDCCLPVTKRTSEASDVCPTEDAIRALLENLVDPLLPLKPSPSDVPSKDLRESVAKQVVPGKGHEAYQLEGDKKEFYDDREECREALQYVDELHQAGIDTSEFPWQ